MRSGFAGFALLWFSFQQVEDLLPQHLLESSRIPYPRGFARDVLHQTRGGLNTDVGRDQDLFEVLQHVIVDTLVLRKQCVEIGGQQFACFGKAAAQPFEDAPGILARLGLFCCRCLGGGRCA